MTRYYTHLGSGVKHDLVHKVQQTRSRAGGCSHAGQIGSINNLVTK